MLRRVSGRISWFMVLGASAPMLTSCGEKSSNDSEADSGVQGPGTSTHSTDVPAPTVSDDGAGGSTGDGSSAATSSSAPPDTSSINSTPPQTSTDSSATQSSTLPPDDTGGAGGVPGLPTAAGGTGGLDDDGEGGDGGDPPVSSGGAGGDTAGPVVSGTPVVYVGGYGGGTYPLTIYDLDKASGALTPRAETADAGESPSYLTVAPNNKVLVAANEVDGSAGGLTSLAIGDDGSLTRIGHVSGTDGGFTYVAVDPSGRFAFGASYNGGSISVFPLSDDGTLGEQLDTEDFGGMAQSHSVGFSPDGDFVFVPNKGNDEVAVLMLDDDGVTPYRPNRVPTAEGAGPRHIAVSADGAFAYVINELNNTVTSFTAGSGVLTLGTSVSSLPADYNGQNTGAHVELSPDGRFLYASNRGHNSIAVFAVDDTTGELTLLEHEPSGGPVPRDFDVDPAGDVLIVAAQDAGTLHVKQIAADGTLSPLGEAVDGPPQPVAVQIVYVNQ